MTRVARVAGVGFDRTYRRALPDGVAGGWVAAAIAHAVHGAVAFGLVAFAATAAHFGIGSLGPALRVAAGAATRHDERRAHVRPD